MAFGGPDNYIGKVNYNLFYFNKSLKGYEKCTF